MDPNGELENSLGSLFAEDEEFDELPELGEEFTNENFSLIPIEYWEWHFIDVGKLSNRHSEPCEETSQQKRKRRRAEREQ